MLLLGLSAQIYADPTALGGHIRHNSNFLNGDELFEGNSVEYLHEEVCVLRGDHGEAIAHMPVSQIQIPWI